MFENTEWMHTGEAENEKQPLKVWDKQSVIDGEKFLHYKYTDVNDKIIGVEHQISFS